MDRPHVHPPRFDYHEPPDIRVFTCTKVAGGAPVLYVSHDEDGAWQFLCGGDHADQAPDGPVLSCLGCMVAADPSLNDAAGLAPGETVTRERAGAAWTNPDADPRWRRVLAGEWTCATCGERHEGLFDLACGKPDHWQGSEEPSPNSEALRSQHFLSEDFCVVDGEHFFVRCVLGLPLIGGGGQWFGYGVWSSLSRKNFLTYAETFDSGEQGVLGPWFGWFSNSLKGYPETLNLRCQVHPRSGRQRPWIELESTDLPLAVEQREGVAFDRMVELLVLNGHAPIWAAPG